MQLFNDLVPAGESRANSAEAKRYDTVSKIYELRALSDRLLRTASGSRACFAGLVDANWILVRSVVSAALCNSQIKVSAAICYVYYSFLIEASPEAPDSSALGWPDQS